VGLAVLAVLGGAEPVLRLTQEASHRAVGRPVSEAGPGLRSEGPGGGVPQVDVGAPPAAGPTPAAGHSSASSDQSEQTSSAAVAYEEWVTFFGDHDGTWGTWVMRLDGSGLRKVPANNDEQVDPAWSPDGTMLAFADGDELVITTPDGSHRRVLPVGGPGERFAWPAWSPDGKQIVATVCPGRRYCSGELWLIDVGTGAARYLTEGQGAGWHPDGRRLAFVHVGDVDTCLGGVKVADIRLTSDGYCHGNIRTIDLVTGHEEALGLFGHFPRYSPDGSMLLWERYNGESQACDVVVAPVESVRQWRSITGAGYDIFPAWTPDGRIVFNKLTPGNLGAVIWIMNPDGSQARALQPATASLNWSIFPNVGRRVVG
jgi:Tol biopolymer transport system component